MATVILASCDQKGKMISMAEENLRQTVDYPKQLKILAVSEPDSAFGNGYFSQKEIKGMVTVMQKVTEDIMKRTNNMSQFDPTDHYVMDMAERQMRAMSDIRSLVRHSEKKGEWSGWKIKVDFEAKSKNGIGYKAERWFFFDKKGESILQTLELPLP